MRIAQPGEEMVGTVIKQDNNPWDTYNTSTKILALIEELRIKDDPTCYRVLKKRSQKFQSYSKKTLDMCRECLKVNSIEDI